jgi:enoyl-CoA hydratase
MTTVGVERVEDVVVVTIDRPPANALAPDLLADALAVLDALTAESPGAVVLTGAGPFFSGGADLRLVPALPADEQADMARGVNRLFAGWHGFARPLVTAVNGHAVAGGLILAMCGDYRVVSTTGRFGLTEVKVGIPYPSAAMAVVQAELPAPIARRLVLRGELHDAATMIQLGVFDEMVTDGEVLSRALAVAHELAGHPTKTYELVKRRLRAGQPVGSSIFGGASETGWALEEAQAAAAKVLEERA